jgi:hypothetical protein
MKFAIYFGEPEMRDLWLDLSSKHRDETLDGSEAKLFKRLIKTLALLENNPLHNSLQSHEIEPLSKRFGRKVFQSYLENNTPGAGRLFWCYGPTRGAITIIGIDSHPEDRKSKGYDRIRLSSIN